MPLKAIMRAKKLASMGSVAGSLSHALRERETSNADSDRTPDNIVVKGAETVDGTMGRLRDALPDKRRKDAVLVIEYMMSASPEWWEKATAQERQDHTDSSMKWLADKYGEENILLAVVHNDEKSQHVSAFVVPRTKDGRLSAKEFIGDRKKMSDDQTTYAKAVEHLGLERGVEGSKAKHQSIKEYYGRLNSATPKTAEIKLPESTVLESKSAYGKKVAESVLAQIKPEFSALAAKASDRDRAVKHAELKSEQLDEQTRRLKPVVDALGRLKPSEQKFMVGIIEKATEKLIQERPKSEAPQLSKVVRIPNGSKDRS